MIRCKFILWVLLFSFGVSNIAYAKQNNSPVAFLDTLTKDIITLPQLLWWLKTYRERDEARELVPLVEAILDHKKNYAPQALRKLSQICTAPIPNSDTTLRPNESSLVKNIACLYNLIVLDQMGRNQEAITLYERLDSLKVWQQFSDEINFRLLDFINSSYWRSGLGTLRLGQLQKQSESKDLPYKHKRHRDVSLIRMKYSIQDQNVYDLIAELDQWEKRYGFRKADRDYYKILSFKADLFGSVGKYVERHKLLKSISSSPIRNYASFPELRLSAVSIDLGHDDFCNDVLSRAIKRINLTPEYLKLLLYSEAKLTAVWCAFSEGALELALKLINELSTTPQRVGYRYRTVDQWNFMIYATQYVVIRAYIDWAKKIEGFTWKTPVLYYDLRVSGNKLRRYLSAIIRSDTPILNAFDIAVLPTTFYPMIEPALGDISDLASYYKPSRLEPWYETWMHHVFDRQPLGTTFAGPQVLRLIGSDHTEQDCRALLSLNVGLAFASGCASDLTSTAPKVEILDHREGVVHRYSERQGSAPLTLKQGEDEQLKHFKRRLLSYAYLHSHTTTKAIDLMEYFLEPK